METDELFARKLQEEFDKEDHDRELQSKKDALLAQRLAESSHEISDSESDEEDTNKIVDPKNVAEEDATIESKDDQKSGTKRPLCKYGSKCYRKNVSHIKEFYHPEDNLSQPQGSSSEVTPQKRTKLSASTSRAQGKNHMNHFSERLKQNKPLGFFLNKIYSVPDTQKDFQTLVFPDLLNSKLGTLIESAQLNFMIDLEFVMNFYKTCDAAKTPVLFMYGMLEGNARDYEGVTCVKVNMPFQYGVHHTKMMMLHYKEGLRVVIHTANLIPDDWNEKTQGYWVSPLFPALAEGQKSLLEGDSKTNFKRDLVDYLLSYKCQDLIRWTHIIKGHNFSSCNVYFVGSVPGYHIGENRFKYGHLKCRNVIRKNSNWKCSASLPAIIQCSSIGSLGNEVKSWLGSELAVSLMGGNDNTSASVKIIYPSEDDVRNSSQGYDGGSCLPYNSNTHKKQLWLLNHLHSWRSEKRHRTRSMPHIKTYTRLSSDLKEAQYFLLTSSNLSKAAWGQIQKQGTQIFIRSYEAGVLWLPEQVIQKNSFTLSSSYKEDHLTLPYDVPLHPYPSNAKPWLMDTQKVIPDTFGNKYP